MAFCHEAFVACRFPLQLGWTGDDLMESEKAEVYFALKREGRAALYVPGMRVDHEIAAERLPLDWAARRCWFDGASCARLQSEGRQWARDAALMIARLAWLAVTRPLPRTKFRRLLWRPPGEVPQVPNGTQAPCHAIDAAHPRGTGVTFGQGRLCKGRRDAVRTALKAASAIRPGRPPPTS